MTTLRSSSWAFALLLAGVSGCTERIFTTETVSAVEANIEFLNMGTKTTEDGKRLPPMSNFKRNDISEIKVYETVFCECMKVHDNIKGNSLALDGKCDGPVIGYHVLNLYQFILLNPEGKSAWVLTSAYHRPNPDRKYGYSDQIKRHIKLYYAGNNIDEGFLDFTREFFLFPTKRGVCLKSTGSILLTFELSGRTACSLTFNKITGTDTNKIGGTKPVTYQLEDFFPLKSITFNLIR